MAVLFKTENPIFHREVMYQQRGVLRRFRHERLLNVLVLTLVLVVALMSQRGRFFPPEFWLIWGIRGLTAFRAIMAGADVISREYAEQTWEPLLLTGVSAPQIFLGKWQAVLSRMWGWGMILGVSWWVLALMQYRGYYNARYYSAPQDALPWLMVGSGLIIVLTTLEILGSSALSIAASAVTRQHWGAVGLATVMRFTPVVLGGIAAFGTMRRFGPSNIALFGIADGGSLPVMLLMMPSRFPGRMSAMPGVFWAMFLLLTLLALAIVIGLIAIMRSGALVHREQQNAGI
ncbi:MAG: hypothetical protein IT324_26305 [Anaerolineae bacterium]|nr:hypothetical protein [Anaerolineae bacterium]